MSQDMQDNTQPQSWLRKNKTPVIVLGALAVVIIVVVSVISYTVSETNKGETKEQRLSQVYSNSIITLSSCLDKGRVAAQVSEEQFNQVEDLLVNTAAARYTDESAADAAIGGGQMFSGVAEAYPEVDMTTWNNLQTIVVGCRDEFKGSQQRIQQEARLYNEWRVNNDIFNTWIKAGFPSDELRVTTPDGTPLSGMNAYSFITREVTVEDARTAFQKGELGEQDLFGDN